MAVDPRLSTEEKRRLEQRRTLMRSDNFGAVPAAFRVARDQGATGLARTVGEGLSEAKRAIGDTIGTGVDTFLYGSGGPSLAAAEAPSQNTPPPAAPDPRQLRAQEDAVHADAIRRDPGQFGLTRIYKTRDANGNSVYSNIGSAPVGAEVRYYNQYGNRETGSSNPDPTVVNPALDPGRTDRGLLIAASHGRASLPYVQRGALARAEVDQRAMLDALPPEERARLLERQAQEQGLDSRAAADRGLRREVAAANLSRADRLADATIGNLAFTQDQALAKIERDDPAAAIAQQIDSLKNMRHDDKLRVLSNPNDPRTARIIGLIERQAHAAGAGPDTSLAQFRKTGGLRRLLTDSTFSDSSGAFGIGNGFNPNDFGMTEEDFQTVLDGYLNTKTREQQ